MSDLIKGLVFSCLLIGSSFFLSPGAGAHSGCNDGGGFNIVGKDSGRVFGIKGNAGSVNVNNISSTEHGVTRAAFVATDLGLGATFIEFGWRLGPNYSETNPQVFVAVSVNGAYSVKHQGQNLAAGTHRFKLEDSNEDTVWGFTLNGNELAYTFDANFSVASAFSLTEIESDGCDTGYSNWTNLTDCSDSAANCNSYLDWSNLQCREDTLGDYHFNKTGSKSYLTEEPNAGAC